MTPAASPPSPPNDSLVVSYLALRKCIGVIGIALPFALALGHVLAGGAGIVSSVSGYYWTAMRDVLVGALSAIAVFLLSYRGYEQADDVAGDLACVLALGVALCPTAPPVGASATQLLVGKLHFAFAAGLFLVLAFFSLVLFRKTDPTRTPTPRKLQRNVVYTVCGYVILACVALAAVVSLFADDAPVKRLRPVFWLEALAVVAFGVSWLTKGEAILGDT